MPNKSSPHGGFISEGTIIHGTLRTQDLLRAFADEIDRVLPFNSFSVVYDARRAAAERDADIDDGMAEEVLADCFDQLDSIAAREGMYFGAHPGDGSDFGYWKHEQD